MSNIINKQANLYAGDKFAITTTDGRKLRLVIKQDDYPEDPRSWDNLGTMLCCNRNYQLGDCNSNRETEEQLAEICRKYGKTDEEIDEMDFYDEVKFLLNQENICALPLWLYDHSGISISTGRVDAWDSSPVGLIYVEKELFIEAVGYEPDDWKSEAVKILREEIETYDDFVQGNVYTWALYEPTVVIRQTMSGEELSRETDNEGKLVDSMGGLYNPTLETISEYFGFEIETIEQID